MTTPTLWTIDSLHSSAEFELSHLGVSTYRGRFRVLTGTLELNEADFQASKMKAEVDVRSVDVEPGPLLDRLFDAEFFDVARHPKLEFQSTRFEKRSENDWKVTGSLSIRGVQQPVTFDVATLGTAKHPFTQQTVRAFRATAAIDRGDFGLKWNAPLDTGGKYLGERVSLTLFVELGTGGGAR